VRDAGGGGGDVPVEERTGEEVRAPSVDGLLPGVKGQIQIASVDGLNDLESRPDAQREEEERGDALVALIEVLGGELKLF